MSMGLHLPQPCENTKLYMVYSVTSCRYYVVSYVSLPRTWFPYFSSDMEFELFSSSIHDLKYFHILKAILLRAVQRTKTKPTTTTATKLPRNANVQVNAPKLMPAILKSQEWGNGKKTLKHGYLVCFLVWNCKYIKQQIKSEFMCWNNWVPICKNKKLI